MASLKARSGRQFLVFFLLHFLKSSLGCLLSSIQVIYLLVKFNPNISPRSISTLRRNGLISIENFLSKESCDQIATEIANRANVYTNSVVSEPDFRIFNAENSIAALESFYSNKLLLGIGFCYLGMPLRNSGTMANIVPAGRNANGSGGSWHRDSNFPQYKALVYVSDVNLIEDGAFQYIPKSNRMKYILREIYVSKRSISDTRWTNDDLFLFQKDLPISVTGKAGTLVLFDTSLLHRGSPNSNSFSKPRVAITNYYYPIIGSIGDSYAK